MQLANFGHPFQRLSAAAEPDRAEPSWRGGFHALGAAARKRRHNGVRHSLVGGLPDPVLEQLLDAMVFYRLLSEGETMDQTRVEAALSDLARRLLVWWSGRWRTLDLMGLNP